MEKPEDCICPLCKGCGLEMNMESIRFGGTYFFLDSENKPYRKKCIACKGHGSVHYVNGQMVPRKAPKAISLEEEVIRVVSDAVRSAIEDIRPTIEAIRSTPPQETSKKTRKRGKRRKHQSPDDVKVGDTFGDLEVIEPVRRERRGESRYNTVRAKCRCSCGNIEDKDVYQMIYEKTTRCFACSRKIAAETRRRRKAEGDGS